MADGRGIFETMEREATGQGTMLWRGPASHLARYGFLLDGWRGRRHGAGQSLRLAAVNDNPIVRKVGSPRALPIGLALSAFMALACFVNEPAAAQSAAPANQPSPPSLVWTPAGSQAGSNSVDFFTGFWRRDNMLGDMGGIRTFLGRYGVTFNLQEVSEALGNVTGGVRQGFTYDGLTTATLAVDTDAALGWEGGSFNISALQIHGRNLSALNLLNLQTASGIEANRATRLWELWYQQAMLDGNVDVKIGQQSVDQEFMASTNTALFVNTMLGWPMVPSADLMSGGPAYPLSSPGLRLRLKPSDAVTLLAGVYDDNPPGPGTNDPQVRNASGTNFRTSDSPLFLGEVQYSINQPAEGAMDYGNQKLGLPGTYKLGMWYDGGKFADQEYDNTGLSLNDPSTSGTARQHRGNYSLYAVVDQVVWQEADGGPQSLSFFTRPMGTPLQDRNQINFSLNIGLTLKAPLDGRDDDTAGFAFGYASVGSGASGLDRDNIALNGSTAPVRSSEKFIELTYQYQIAPWWILQPDFQYVFNPGGGIANPNNTGQVIGDEAVIGMRTTINF